MLRVEKKVNLFVVLVICSIRFAMLLWLVVVNEKGHTLPDRQSVCVYI